MAKRTLKKETFKWDVQPYQFAHELMYNYTQAAIFTTRKEAEGTAKEATQWMRENAPWKDITGRARKGLWCVVATDFGEEERYLAGRTQAEKAEKKALAKENRQRDKANKIPLKALPKSRSVIAQFEREFARGRVPIVELIFTHNQRLPYTVWLEIANNGRYAIIARAIDYWSPKMMQKVKRIANLMQYQGQNLVQQATQYSQYYRPEVELENFNRRVAAYNEKEGDNAYKPWSPERQAKAMQDKYVRKYGPQVRGRYRTVNNPNPVQPKKKRKRNRRRN